MLKGSLQVSDKKKGINVLSNEIMVDEGQIAKHGTFVDCSKACNLFCISGCETNKCCSERFLEVDGKNSSSQLKKKDHSFKMREGMH